MRKRRLRRRLADAIRSEVHAREETTLLARETARLRLALEAIPQLLVVWDEDGKVVVKNRLDPDTALPPSSGPLLDAAIDDLGKAQAEAVAVSKTVALRGPRGRQLVLRSVPLRKGDDCLGLLAVVDDVSERLRLDAVRRDFVANVSHELRTPVGALALLGEALCGETDPLVVSRLAERITAEADRAARMIEDLLDLSRIEAGGPVGPGLVHIGSIVAAAVDRAAPVAQLRCVRIHTSIGRARDTQVRGDEHQLISAVANLVDNAVKYSDPETSVKVTARVVGPDVYIAVRDRGIGIPATDLERIFERFYRVDRARSRGTGGTGLGLSIVRHVVTNHGGEISVESAEGAGSTFTVRLPVGPEAAS